MAQIDFKKGPWNYTPGGTESMGFSAFIVIPYIQVPKPPGHTPKERSKGGVAGTPPNLAVREFFVHNSAICGPIELIFSL